VQAGLLAEDHGFGVHADCLVDLFVLDETFGIVLLGEAVLHGSVGAGLGLMPLFGKVIL
jgi:hypothetical protein